jgi:hypothetical protein
MSFDEFRRVENMLHELEPHIKDMKGQAPVFLKDQIARAAKWQTDMFLSPKQLQWIESLYEEHCGEPPEPKDMVDDLDDDKIPF